MSSKEEFDFSALDIDMADIEDLPGFEVPPNGEYLLNLKTEYKAINDVPAVAFNFEVQECLKKDKDTDDDPKPGSKFSVAFQVGHGDAEKKKVVLGMLKQFLAGVAEQVGQGNVGVILRDHLSSAVVRATVRRVKDKDDPEKLYARMKNLLLA